MNIHEKLNEWVESQKDSPEPAVLTKPEVKRLFEECGVEEEKWKPLTSVMKPLPEKCISHGVQHYQHPPDGDQNS